MKPVKITTGLFWFLLLLPGVVSLSLFAMGRGRSFDPLAGASPLLWLLSTLYTGVWLGMKCGKLTIMRVVWSCFFIAGLAVLNACIMIAGCSAR